MKSKIKNKAVRKIFENYPEVYRSKLLFLRELIFEVVSEDEDIVCEETIKWGEPSYIAKKGSTIRIAWNSKKPEQYGIYFNCNTILIETFKELYGDKFNFEGKRAIVFKENDEIPVPELKQCILAALTYHKRKHKPFLGL